MPKKIRVYELARELGLTNKEALDLCIGLGIGVKSHSSSIEDAQADRVRRKADREGLRREVAPEEPAPAKKAGKKAGATAEAPSPAAEAPASSAERAAEPALGEPAPGLEVPGPLAPARPAESRPAEQPVAPPEERPAAAAAEPAAEPAAPPGVRPGGPRLVTSRPASEQPDLTPPPRPAPRQPEPAVRRPPESPPPPSPGTRPAPPGMPAGHSGKPLPPPPPSRADVPPLSRSGKPIPPPPGRGRPMPPPPGAGARGGPPGAGRPPPGVGRPGAPARPSGTGGPRPGGFGAGGRPGGGFAPGGRGAPPGGMRGGPGPGGFGGRGGPGGRPRPQRRTSARRRRREFEELEPTQLTSYVPSNAPVPEGEVIVERGATAQELGPKLNRSAADVVRFLLQQGEMVTATMSLSDEQIELFALEIGALVRLVDPGEEKEVELQRRFFGGGEEEEDEADLRTRPPVITVMGHVDHGKTLLLDRIRETNVVAQEAGGITQHIGAYQAENDGRLVTFIDTPGHEAFTAMRARGARVTDIAVLVVAADDGVMPQTVEAINHALAAEVPIVVAINKVDRDDSDPNRTRQQLSEHGLVPEEWGGDTIMVEISALQNLGIDDLLEQLLLVADVLELQANPEDRGRGIVLEANLDVGRGPVATVVVQHGTLRVGDPVVAGAAWGRVRALIDDKGDNIKEAPPSTPVQVLGFSEVPLAGDEFRVTADDKTAREIGELREQRYRSVELRKTSAATTGGAKLEDIFEQIQRGETATLNLILKADVHGSLEALTESLRKLERDEVKLAFVHRGVGGITESDVQLASASNATIIGFNVRPDRKARELAEQDDVELRTYEIIYQILEDIEAAMVGMLKPEYEEVVTGEAEVREVFRVPRVGAVAGCYVRHGAITRGSRVRFLRDGTVIWKGSITSLKRFKDDAREVASGFECGIGLSDFQDLKQGDLIETFEEREIPRT